MERPFYQASNRLCCNVGEDCLPDIRWNIGQVYIGLEVNMAARRRHRYGRRGQSYKVILDDGSEMFVGASEFLINKEMGNLVRDKANPRVARARKWLRVRVDETTGQLVFESTQKKRPGHPVHTTNRLLLEEWLRADPTLTRQQARQRMLLSLPRVLTETVCLY